MLDFSVIQWYYLNLLFSYQHSISCQSHARIQCRNIMESNLESHAIAIDYCFGVRQSHVQFFSDRPDAHHIEA